MLKLGEPFASLSNENEATANHLLSRPLWPKQPGASLADIGCGDGKLLDEILKLSEERVSKVWLIDPDAAFLAEARQTIRTGHPTIEICPLAGTGEDQVTAVDRADAVLAVHVVYLMKDGALQSILDWLPMGTALYVILDDCQSVFTTIWQRTQPEYFERVQAAHQLMAELPAGKFRCDRTTISSALPDLETIQDQEIQRAVLSLLCYRNMTLSHDSELLDWVVGVLRQRSNDGFIQCESACYEIVRR